MKIFRRIMEAFLPSKITKATYNEIDEVMKVEFANGSKRVFKGDVSVWNELPLMNHCSVFEEGTLCDIQKYIKHHGNPYPTAHLSKEKPKILS